MQKRDFVCIWSCASMSHPSQYSLSGLPWDRAGLSSMYRPVAGHLTQGLGLPSQLGLLRESPKDTLRAMRGPCQGQQNYRLGT